LGQPGEIVSVKTLCTYPFVDELITETGDGLPLDSHVHIGSEKTKTVRKGHKQVIVVTANEDAEHTGIPFRTITKKEAKAY
jgi:hypothetical protein